MSAETLRRAAALMRENAQAATPGPWDVSHWREGGKTTHHTLCKFETRVVRGGEERGGFLGRQVAMTYADAQGHADFTHIASWHPAVALAVADWLDREADEHERYVSRAIKHTSIRTAYANDRAHHALTVAHAYLGEQP